MTAGWSRVAGHGQKGLAGNRGSLAHRRSRVKHGHDLQLRPLPAQS